MKIVINLLAFMGLLLSAYWIYNFITARRYQAQETERFFNQPSAQPRLSDQSLPSESPTSVNRPYHETGSTVAILAIPRLGLSTVVVEGAGERELKLGPGHIRGTALPGEGGNVGLAGHRDTFFRPLRFTRNDDTIQVTTREREYLYKVVSTEIVEPDDVQVLYPTGHETLTLVTCYPFDFVGPAPKRFVVRADCVDGPPDAGPITRGVVHE